MAEALEPPGDGGKGGSFRPFDRQALQATLADALRDAEAADQQVAAGDTEAAAAPAAGAPAPAPAASPPPAPAPVPAAPKLNPFGSRAGGGAPAPAASARPAPNTPRTGPSILSGGISGAISPMSPGGVGGGSISGLRPPGGGLGGGLGARPLPGMGALGSTSQTIDEPVEAAPTISLRRPTRPEPAAPEPAAEAPPPPAPARASVPVAAWLPTDDDILPRSQGKRKGRRH